MTNARPSGFGALLAGLAIVLAVPAHAQMLTVDRAVEMALEASTLAIHAEATVLDAKGGVYAAYSTVLPHLRASLTRGLSGTEGQTGSQVFGGFVTPSTTLDRESYFTTPTLSGSWNILNLSSLSGLSAARNSLKSAQLGERASRNGIVLLTKTQYYDAVRAIHLLGVRTGALKLARDEERRVRALFEVGSVSRSDVMSAQVRTAQSELDSLIAQQDITLQRNRLAELVGVPESEMGAIDTSLTAQVQTYDEAAVLEEARQARPDLQAAEAELKAARANLNAARFTRLPYVAVQGSMDISPDADTKTTFTDTVPNVVTNTTFESDRDYQASISLNWDFFDGLAADSRTAFANARLMRARDQRDLIDRNLAAEVHRVYLAYLRAAEGQRVTRRAIDSAEEHLNLTAQKYNVGSATILELVDAQVQLETVQSDLVSALALIRVAEAELDRVRGRGAP
jgi:outer membrane protein TolC